MDTLTVDVAQYVPSVVAVVLIHLAGVHTDPRPFVLNPSIRPRFRHPADNGFPSDHPALTAAVALLVMAYRRWAGLVLLAAGVLVGVARVAAHVHHDQGVVAGVVIAVVAAGVTTGALAWVRPLLTQRSASLASV